MPHPEREEILRACEGGWAEVEALAEHLAECAACRLRAAGLLRDRPAILKRAPLLKALIDLASFEKGRALDRLLATAEMAEFRRLTRGRQKERVILSRFCHSPAFLEALLEILRAPRSRDESESLTSLAVLAAQAVDPTEGSEAFKNDHLAMIWIEAANARRMRGEWQHAGAALSRAEEHIGLGSGRASIKARWLSIAGSLHCDQGRRDEAIATLRECREIYARQCEWPQVGRTLVQMAHCIADDDPEQALALLDRATAFIASEAPALRALAGRIRTDCLITLGRIGNALRAFAESESVRPLHGQPTAALRSTFLAARLLEVLGHIDEAETLFESVVTEEFDREHLKDAILDLLYIFEFHLRLGTPARAADLAARALGGFEDRDDPMDEECRALLARLVDAARAQSLDESMLRASREAIRAKWRRARAAGAAPAHGGGPMPVPDLRAAVPPESPLVEPLLARALWFRLRQQMSQGLRAPVAQSPKYHTRAFVELLVAGVSQAGSREEAEFMASLGVQAIPPMAAPASLKHDLSAQLWTEVANARRVASEWSKASAALRQAGKHLAKGTGNNLLKARRHSVSASLLADQGRIADAVAALEECAVLYERHHAWPEVGRTLVQMAHTLVDTEPARALALIDQAAPFIVVADLSLRCLAENIRADGLITLGAPELALQAFDLAAPLRGSGVSVIARRRSDFIAARLLERLGHYKEAVQLFEAVVGDAFDHEAYREAFLDLLYLFGAHLRQGATERAVAVCRLAIERLDLFGLGHEQLRTVWVELSDAAMRRVIRLDALIEVRQFLKTHWKTPAERTPRFAFE